MRQNYGNINIDELKEIVLKSDSLVDATKKLGLNPYYGNIKKNVERLIKRNNISIEHFSTVKRVREYTVRYDKDTLIKLVQNSRTLKDVLEGLDILPIESNYKTLKKYLNLYRIDFSHIKRYRLKCDISPKYSEENFKLIVSNSITFREVFEKLGLDTYGNNYGIVHKYIKKYNIDISHFNSNKVCSDKLRKINTIPLNEILIENSTYNNGTCIKKRLYDEELKERVCEKCGQDEWWYGEKISLILDHINGKHNDNRFENLRILCPDCNSTLPTHCGKNTKRHKKVEMNNI